MSLYHHFLTLSVCHFFGRFSVKESIHSNQVARAGIRLLKIYMKSTNESSKCCDGTRQTKTKRRHWKLSAGLAVENFQTNKENVSSSLNGHQGPKRFDLKPMFQKKFNHCIKCSSSYYIFDNISK